VTGGLVDRLANCAALPSLSLEDVNATAALQTRRDRKYLVTPDVLLDAIRALPSTSGLGVLHVAGRFEQQYSSIYFDTDDLLLYRLAATGRRRRFKVRRRVYVDDGMQMLEVKTKDPKGRTAKARTETARSVNPESEQLSDDERAFVAHTLCSAGVWQHPPLHTLRATVQTGYVRTTLAAPAAQWRATIDQQLVGGRAGQCPRLLGDCVVVETKSSGAPTPLDRALWARGSRPQRVSKFAVAMALSEPGLPANRWNRVLREHLDWQRSES
jgi:hypothetical protein